MDNDNGPDWGFWTFVVELIKVVLDVITKF
jgi:hypothetical protein